jgi:hypothetical protein
MPDFKYTGTLRIDSNDPNTPREIGLQALQSTFFVPVTFTSYEGDAIIHGITELGDLSDPPRKYRQLVADESEFARQEIQPGPGNLANIRFASNAYTGVNESDTKYAQQAYQTALGNKGQEFQNPPYTSIPLGLPWWMGVLGTGGLGGAATDSFEDVAAPGLGPYGWADGVNWFDLPFEKGKTWKTLKAPDGFDVDADEYLDSPVLFFKSMDIGSSTDTRARFNIRITAERGGGGGTYNIYVRWDMGQPPIGSGPLSTVYLQARRGNQPVICDAVTGMRLGNLQAGPGSGSVYKYRRFGLPVDTSFRLYGIVQGELNDHQFPRDLSYLESNLDDDTLEAAGLTPWFYLPEDVPAGTLLRDQTHREVLVNEDPIPDAMIANGANTVAANLWARTTSVTGGITAESHAPITFTGTTVRASFTMTGLTPLQVYSVELTFEQRQIGEVTSTFIKETIDVVPGLDTEKLVEFDIISPEGFERRLYATSVTGSAPQPEEPDGVDRVGELIFEADAIDAGASYTAAESAAIAGFLNALQTKPYKNNLKYVLPFMGNDLASSLLPCWDVEAWGPPTNTNFVDADCSTATGLRANGSSKYLTMPFRNYEIGGNQLDKSGQGVYFNQNDWGGTSGQWIGANWESGNTQIFGLRIGDYRALYYHGSTGEPVGAAVEEPTENAHYFGVAFSDTSRKIYKNGILQDTNTNAVNSSGANGSDCYLFGDNLGGNRYSASSLFVAYYTDGSAIWTDANVLDLHNLIQTWLIDGVGRSVSSVNPDLATFKTRVASNSGTLGASGEALASDLTAALRGFSAYEKLRYTAAFLGDDLNALLIPVYDPALSGPMTNNGFTLTDLNQSIGAQGSGNTGANHSLIIPRNANELGSSQNGGMGYREMNFNNAIASAWQPCGFERSASGWGFELILRQAVPREAFSWQAYANAPDSGVACGNHNYYGQRSSATSREMFRNGVSIASDATNDTAANAGDSDIYLMAIRELAGATFYFGGRCGLFYLTNGELTGPEVAELHTIIEDFITATGR